LQYKNNYKFLSKGNTAMKKLKKSPLAIAMGSIVISSFSTTVSAEANPFNLTELNSPYMQLAAADENNNKVTQGGCASSVTPAKPQHGKQPATTEKSAEGSFGEGKCGAMMSGGKMKKGMENSSGAMMKNKESSCCMMNMNHDAAPNAGKSSEMSCGAMMKGKDGSCGAMMKNGSGSCGAAVDANKAAGK